MPPEPCVYVVDDDAAARDSLSWLLSSVGLHVETYPSAREFQEAFRPGTSGCVIVDVRMPGISGLELHRELQALDLSPPVIIITGHGDVSMAVHAMKAGAFDFIEKPFNDQVLLDRVQAAIDESSRRHREHAESSEIENRVHSLTPREREVLDLVVTGESNKGIAHRLGISEKTVEAHRAKVMEKIQARSVTDLVKMVMTLGAYQGKP